MKFQSSLREVMLFIKYSKDREALKKMVAANEGRFKNLERRAADVITAVTRMKANFEEEKENVNMCQALQEMCDEFEAIGIAKGIAKGRAEGWAEGKLQKAREIAKNFHAMGIRIEQIVQGVGCPVETVKEWLEIQ